MYPGYEVQGRDPNAAAAAAAARAAALAANQIPFDATSSYAVSAVSSLQQGSLLRCMRFVTRSHINCLPECRVLSKGACWPQGDYPAWAVQQRMYDPAAQTAAAQAALAASRSRFNGSTSYLVRHAPATCHILGYTAIIFDCITADRDTWKLYHPPASNALAHCRRSSHNVMLMQRHWAHRHGLMAPRLHAF